MENIKEKIQEHLDIVRWQGYISGKVEGAMDVLYEIDLDMEERIRLLQRVAGLSRITAEEFIEPREIKHRIFKNKELSYKEKQNLSALMSNEIMDSTQALDHPKETIRLIASVNTEKYRRMSPAN